MEKLKNKIVVVVLLLIFVLAACEKTPFEKPDKLIKENQMINMLVDIHMAESTFNHFRHDSAFQKSSSSEFYYSILNKYQVPDTVFEKSFLYYASNPRKFEKMYQKVMNKLSEIEQKYSGRKEDPLDFKEPAKVK